MGIYWAIPIGLLVGVALGTLGGGGSIMTVPALVYLMGQTPAAATTGSLIIVGITSLVGTAPHHKRGNVQWVRGLVFGLLGIVGSYVGARLAAGVAPEVLLSAFSMLMLVVAFLMWQRLRKGRGEGGDAKVHPVKTLLAATGVGLLTGFFGVGGGFAVVPALVLALGLSMPAAVGTSLLVIAINSTSALVSRMAGGSIELDWPVIAAFSGFAIIGSLLGGRLSAKLDNKALTKAFIVMLIVVAGYMAAMNVPLLFK